MGIRRGSILTPIIADGLVFNMDAANRASTIPSTSTDKTFNTVDTSVSGSFINDTFYDSSTITPSYAFDGAEDYINIGAGLCNVFGSSYNGSITVSSWINTDTTSGNDGIFQLGNLGNIYGFLNIHTAANYLYVHTSTTNNTSKNQARSGNISSIANNWTNITVIWDLSNSSNNKVYMNGALLSLDQDSFATGTANLTGEFSSIGAYYSTTTVFDGNIGPIQIYNRALSANEVLHNYNALKSRFGL